MPFSLSFVNIAENRKNEKVRQIALQKTLPDLPDVIEHLVHSG